MASGWVKLYRKLLDNPRSSNPKWFSLWGHLLLMATHTETDVLFAGKKIKLKPGQFITGRIVLSQKTRISETTIERLLKCMESEHQIGQQKSNRNRLISILAWQDYQESGQRNGQPVDNQWTTSGQQTDTNKNVKNEKNVENDKEKSLNTISLFEEIWERYPNKDGKKTAQAHFQASVKTEQDWQDINRALENYLCSDKVQEGYIKNGSTWFNNWRDWIDFVGIKKRKDSRTIQNIQAVKDFSQRGGDENTR